LDEPVLGVAFDGSGLGTDGAVWGGEFLVADLRGYRRAARGRYVAPPRGGQAGRAPGRPAGARPARRRGGRPPVRAPGGAGAPRAVERMIERGLNSPLTSSAGRLFDAVAALAGVRDRVSYEGQAAVELEGLAATVPPDGGYPFEVTAGAEGELVVDTRPLIA